MAVGITRRDMSASELRAAATRTKDAKAARRMLAIALVLDGADRTTAAESCGMDRQTLRDWVHRFNAEGLDGLSNRHSAGPTPRLNAAQKTELARMVREGPDLATDGVVRWRRIDLKRKIEERFGVVMHERTVGKQLAALGFRRLPVRPQHPKSDPDAQDAFKKTSPPRQEPSCQRQHVGNRWKSGFRMKPGWASRERSPGPGPHAEPALERRAIPVTNGPVFSVPSARTVR